MGRPSLRLTRLLISLFRIHLLGQDSRRTRESVNSQAHENEDLIVSARDFRTLVGGTTAYRGIASTMSKKKSSTPEELMTAEVGTSEEGNAEPSKAANGEPNVASGAPSEAGPTVASPADASGVQVSPEAIEEQKVEAELSGDLARLQKELTALDDRHLRLVAEFTNYRRRAENELSEAWTRGQADMLRSFVEGLDDLQRVGAWQADSTTVEALIEGVDLVERKFRQALESAGVEMIDPLGEVFDPNIMEAMLGVPTEDPENDQKVQDVFEKGYSFKGHLVRPARVTVFKHE